MWIRLWGVLVLGLWYISYTHSNEGEIMNYDNCIDCGDAAGLHLDSGECLACSCGEDEATMSVPGIDLGSQSVVS